MNMINHTMMRERFYEPESRNEHGYNDDVYEPMHTKKEDRNTRRQFNRNAQQQDSYNGITDNQPDEDTSSDQLLFRRICR